MRPLFVEEDKTIRIEFDEDYWVEVVASMSVEKLKDFLVGKSNIAFLQATIKSWNLVDMEENPVECTPENIAKLSSVCLGPLADKVLDSYMPAKKNLEQSKPGEKDIKEGEPKKN